MASPIESLDAHEIEDQAPRKKGPGITDLTPEERSQRARLAAHTLHSKVDARKHTEPGRAALRARWEAEVDPDGILPEAERQRRAKHAQAAHMTRMALRSSVARRKLREALKDEAREGLG